MAKRIAQWYLLTPIFDRIHEKYLRLFRSEIDNGGKKPRNATESKKIKKNRNSYGEWEKEIETEKMFHPLGFLHSNDFCCCFAQM